MARNVHRWLDSIGATASNALGLIGSLALALIMISISGDVILRNVVGTSFRGVVELNTVLLPVLAYLTLAYGLRRDAHISSDVFIKLVPKRFRCWAIALAQIGVILAVSWILVESIGEARGAMERGEITMGRARFPVWPARLALPIGLLVLTYQLVLDLLTDWKKNVDS